MLLDLKKRRRRRELARLLEEEMVGLVEPGVEVEGKLKFTSGMVRLNAHFKGEIVSQGSLVVAEQGEVEAEIRARTVSVAGKVKGSIHASERIEICEHGVVLGDISTPSLIVHPGGYFEGECHMPAAEAQKQPAPDPGSPGRA